MGAMLVIPRNAWTHRTPMERKAQPSVNKPAHPEPTVISLGFSPPPEPAHPEPPGDPRRRRFKREAEGAFRREADGLFEAGVASSERRATPKPGDCQSKSMVERATTL